MSSNSKKKYYQILEVDEGVSQNEITKAYRKLTNKWHPDLWALKSEKEKEQANKKMDEINQAYNVLGNEKKRKEYDLYGDNNYGSGSYSSTKNSFYGSDFQFNDIDDIFGGFSSFFGKSGKSSGSSNYNASKTSKKGEDILITIKLTFKESVLGVKKKIFLKLNKACNYCNQMGYLKESDVSFCSSCKGVGVVNFVILGSFHTQKTCPSCNGLGKTVINKCNYCKGSLFLQKEESIQLTIPRGIQIDRRLKYQRIGNDGLRSNVKGDILVDIEIEKDKYFSRKNNDIHVNLPISFFDSILGGEVSLFTLEEEKKINIEPGVQNGDFFLIKNKGCYLNVNSSSRGNFYVWFQVKTPKNVSPLTRKTFEKIREEANWNPNRDFINNNRDILE